MNTFRRFLAETVLTCPFCKTHLECTEGSFACKGGHVFPVIDNIPRFPTSEDIKDIEDSFNLKWKLCVQTDKPITLWGDRVGGKPFPILFHAFDESQEADRWAEYLTLKMNVSKDYFKGKLLLDAGCGVGWASLAASRLGAKVVAFDVSSTALRFTRRLLGETLEADVYQADVYLLPFKEKTFDIVICLGVLHHTPNTKKGFFELAKLVKSGGELFLYLYEWHNPYKLFLLNLLRRAVQLFSKAGQYHLIQKLAIRDLARPKSAFRASAYRCLGAFVPLIGIPDGDPLGIAPFDLLSPRYNHVHRANEVIAWFREARFDWIRMLDPPVKYRRKLYKFLWGEYGGGLYIRGRRA